MKTSDYILLPNEKEKKKKKSEKHWKRTDEKFA